MSSSPSLVLPFPTPASGTVITNAFLPQQKFQIARHRGYAGEYLKEGKDRHFISQMCESAWAERRGATGNWIRFRIQRGSLSLVPSGPVPEVRLVTSTNMILCVLEKNFTHEVASEIDREPAKDTDFHVRDAHIEKLVDLMITDFEAPGPSVLYSETLAHALAMRFLVYGKKLEHTPSCSVGPLPPRLLRRIRDRIETELDTDLSLASLAKESGYSRAHFLRMFRAATGLTPHQYVLERRLSTAQQLLRQSRVVLADIALRCGFSSQTHMNDVFRKRLGVSPLEYRRNI